MSLAPLATLADRDFSIEEIDWANECLKNTTAMVRLLISIRRSMDARQVELEQLAKTSGYNGKN